MKAVVLGGANCVWSDLERATEIGQFDAVIAVNDAGVEFHGQIDIWVTLHPEKFTKWIARRRENGYPDAVMLAGHEQHARINFELDYTTNYMWPGMAKGGSSGLFAVKVGLEQGFDRIVLCGVPMDRKAAHFFEKEAWNAADDYWPQWETAYPHIRKHVRSMSGKTMRMLGNPDFEWLESGRPEREATGVLVGETPETLARG